MRFEVDAGWGELPDGRRFVEVAGVATDSHDRVFVFNRGEHPVIDLRPRGPVQSSWGEGLFARPHGITIGPDDAVYCTDDLDHTVKKFTPEGTLLLTLGKSGCPSDTGATSRTSGRSARPARRSITRRTWHWPRTARCTSPMDMAMLVSTSSRATAGISPRGASRARARGSSGCRTGSPWGPTARSSWPTARTAASSSSHPTASS